MSYIEREPLQQAIERKKAGPCNRKFTEGYNDAVLRIKSMVSKFPSADVTPVRRGRWEPGNPICPVCGKDKFAGLDADIWSDWWPPFCPNCGADMREETNNENQT